MAGTTTGDFLTWDANSQNAYLQNSISMAGVIASQAKPDIARCLDDWYFVDTATIQMRNTEILGIMASYREFKPQAVLLAVLEDVCGRFDRP